MDGAAVDFALTRFEAVDGARLEIEGRWSGVRGVRFVRPALVVHGESGAEKTLLADLEHKPWPAQEGEPWVAAFPWTGGAPDVARIELAVAPSIVVPLGGDAPAGAERQPAPTRAGGREVRAPGGPEVAALREERDRYAQAARRAAEDLETLRRELAEATARQAAAPPPRSTADREAVRSELRRRDEALAARDAALAARDAALAERDEAVRERDALRRELQEREQIAEGAARRREQALADRDTARRSLAEAEAHAAQRERAAAAEREAALQSALAAAEAERDRALGEPAGVVPAPVRVVREHDADAARADWAARTAAILAVLVLLVLAITFLKAIA